MLPLGIGKVCQPSPFRRVPRQLLGLALQAGIDIPLNTSGMALSLDAKRYFMKVDAKWYDAGGAKVLHTRNTLDPWVLSAGLAWRF